MATPGSRSRIGRASRALGGETLARTKRFTWLYPLVTAVVLGAAGVWAYTAQEDALRTQVRDTLQTILDADIKALEAWLAQERTAVEAIASEPEVRRLATALHALARKNKTTPDTLRASPELKALRHHLDDDVAQHRYLGFALVDRNSRILAARLDEPVGRTVKVGYVTDRALTGETVVTHPILIAALGQPAMVVAAPVREDDGAIYAALAFAVDPHEFTDILSVARIGDSGETYAFDNEGTMVSYSRFEDELRDRGLLGPKEESLLNITVRDPETRQLTRMAVDATNGRAGTDVDGYADYRGVSVVGAWRWLPQYDMGVTTEVDEDEAFRALNVTRIVFWGLVGLLLAGATLIFLYSRVVHRLRGTVERVGQYTLREKIGEGGWGTVYRASHAMLRRETAIKLLRPEDATEQAIRRFEREVQITSQLTHPNTIAIYDYGRTPDDGFYYAMEYVAGATLKDLVINEGPPFDARTRRILMQAAGSLAEAHGKGLIHRDIKPANIMLCERGGVADTVKVLDFGLVKARDEAEITQAGTLLGTPLYLSPEALQQTFDARSDLYSLGAVGYYLVCGRPPFDGETLQEIIAQHVSSVPTPPSQITGREVMPCLERSILRCMAKDPDMRPQSARELLEMLGKED